MNWWEWVVSCGFVLMGHARTLYRLRRVDDAEYIADIEARREYTGPLVDHAEPETTKAAPELIQYRPGDPRGTHAGPGCRCVKCRQAIEQAWDKALDNLVETSYDRQIGSYLRDVPLWPLGTPEYLTSDYVKAMQNLLTSHTCTRCWKTSYNLKDVKNHYCGFCHHFCKDSGEK